MSNSNISIVNLSAYTSPKIQENKKQGYIEYGDDNNYFQFLIDRFLYSTTNGAIITGISNMIYGKGLKSRNGEALSDYVYTLTTEVELRKLVLDYKLYGNGALQVTYNEDRTKIIGFFHIPVSTLRAERVDDEGNICGYYYSPDWDNKKIKPMP